MVNTVIVILNLLLIFLYFFMFLFQVDGTQYYLEKFNYLDFSKNDVSKNEKIIITDLFLINRPYFFKAVSGLQKEIE